MTIRTYVVGLIKKEADKSFEGLQKLLEENPETVKMTINERDVEHENTALHLAAANNRADIVTLLLQHGAVANIQNKTGNTAVECASVNECWSILQLFIDHGLAKDETDSCQFSSTILDAAKFSQWKMVENLLEQKVKPFGWLTIPGRNTLLHFFIKNGAELSLLKKLFSVVEPAKIVFEIKRENDDKEIPVVLAAKLGRWPLFKEMFQYLTKENATGLDLNAFLSLTLQDQQWDIADSIMAMGATLKSYDPQKGLFDNKPINETLSLFLIRHSNNSEAEFNLQQARITYKAQDFEQALAYLLEAIRRGSKEALQFLETEFLPKHPIAQARLALARLYYNGLKEVVAIDYKKVAEYAFTGEALGTPSTEIYFQDARVREHLSTTRAMQLYVRYFYEEAKLEQAVQTGALREVTKPMIAAEIFKNPQWWPHLEGKAEFVFKLFMEKPNRKAMERKEQLDFLLYYFVHYPVDGYFNEKKEMDVYRVVKEVIAANHAEELQKRMDLLFLFYIVSLVNNQLLDDMLSADSHNSLHSTHFDVEKNFMPADNCYPPEKLSKLKILISLYQRVARKENEDGIRETLHQLTLHDEERYFAFYLRNFINESEAITSKSKWILMIQETVWSCVKEKLPPDNTEFCLQKLKKLRSDDLFKHGPVHIGSMFRKIPNPVLIEMDKMIEHYESSKRMVSFRHI